MILLEQYITKPLCDMILSRTNKYKKLEKSQQQHMESKEIKSCNYQLSRIKTKDRIWMDRSSLVATKNHGYKETLLLGIITCKTLKYKAFRTNICEGGTVL